MYKILIIEDDDVIATKISEHIISWGYDARKIINFNNIVSEFIEYNPDLILLDISLPFFDGYYWCSEIRKKSNVPIMFISSAADKMNIIMAVNMGADDFLSKPFDLDVLVAKIKAILKRTKNLNNNNLLECNGIVLNMSNATIEYKNKILELTKNDYKIINTLMENAGKIISREDLMEKLWQTDNYVDENTLTVNITRIRKKLSEIGINDFIITKKGLGYMVK